MVNCDVESRVGGVGFLVMERMTGEGAREADGVVRGVEVLVWARLRGADDWEDIDGVDIGEVLDWVVGVVDESGVWGRTERRINDLLQSTQYLMR